MKLQKLTQIDLQKAAEKGICCYEKSIPHLTELCDKYGVLDRIVLIVDDSIRQQGDYTLQGRRFCVQDPEELEHINWTDNILIITSDFHREVYDQLCCMDSIQQMVDVIYYFADQETEFEDEYRELYKDRELENIIIFRSGPYAQSYVKEMDFSDNARALFEYMLEHDYNRKYQLVWLVKRPEDFPQYLKTENVSFLSFDWSISEKKEERDRYYHALCLAKFLFLTDAYGFARNCREDQIRVQLWHGSGFKTRVNFVRCEKRYDYMTVVSDLYGKIYGDIFGLRPDQMLVTGYAKQDWLFHPMKKDYKKLLHIPEAQFYIYWLPTFRKGKAELAYLNEEGLRSETGFPIVDTEEQMEQLNGILLHKQMVLVIKLHPIQDRSLIKSGSFSNIVLLENEQLFREDIQINQLLGEADALISDYSSAAVDYMLLDRPIAFMLEDVEEYEASRGFLFHPIREWLPGIEIDSFEDLTVFIEEVASGVDSSQTKRRYLRDKMHRYLDDGSCRRILETFNIKLDQG